MKFTEMFLRECTKFVTEFESTQDLVDSLTKDQLTQAINTTLENPDALGESSHPLENIPTEFKRRIIKESFNDPLFFINLMRPSAPEGYVHINPHEKQKLIVETCTKDHYLVILGSRQTGKTTIVFAYACWLMNFYDHYKVGLMVQKDDSLKKAILEFDMLYTSLPSWLRYDKTKDDAREKHLENGSKVQGYLVDPKNPDSSGRGVKVDFLIIDEAAFIPKINKAYTALKPATSRRHLRLKKAGIPYGTVIISTPNGMFGIGKWYYDFWTGAKNNANGFKAIKVHWTDVPEYDEEWYEDTTKDMSERDRLQEYELVFFGSQSAYFPDSVIEQLQLHTLPSDQLHRLKLVHGSLYVKEPPRDDTLYLIGMDPADTGKDFSAIVIFDIFNNKVLGYFYEQNVSALDLLEDGLALGKLIPNSIIIHERNAFSTNVQILYKNLGSHRVYVSSEKRGKSDAYKYAGVTTTGPSRKHMFMSLYTFVERHPDAIQLEPLVDELIALEQKGTRIEAADGHHDDLVMAFSFTLYALDFGKLEDYYKYFTINREEFKEMSKNISLISDLNTDSVTPSMQVSDPLLQFLLDERKAELEKKEIADQLFEQDTPTSLTSFEP